MLVKNPHLNDICKTNLKTPGKKTNSFLLIQLICCAVGVLIEIFKQLIVKINSFVTTKTDILTSAVIAIDSPQILQLLSYCYYNKTVVTWYYLKSLLQHVGSLCSHCVNAPGQLFSSHASTPPIHWKGKRLKCQKLCAISITYVSCTIKN